MPRLTENVLIGGQVRLAGEDVSAADAAGVRSEVFETVSEKTSEVEQKRATQRKRASGK